MPVYNCEDYHEIICLLTFLWEHWAFELTFLCKFRDISSEAIIEDQIFVGSKVWHIVTRVHAFRWKVVRYKNLKKLIQVASIEREPTIISAELFAFSSASKIYNYWHQIFDNFTKGWHFRIPTLLASSVLRGSNSIFSSNSSNCACIYTQTSLVYCCSVESM